MIYILYKNSKHNYTSLYETGEQLNFIFKEEDIKKPSINLNHIWKRLQEVLSKSTEKDKIVLNGPSYLTAIAGYIWLSFEPVRYNMYAYNTMTRQFTLNTEEVDHDNYG